MARAGKKREVRLKDFAGKEKALGWEVFRGMLDARDPGKPFETILEAMAEERPIVLDGFTYLNHEGLLWLLLLAQECKRRFGHALVLRRPTNSKHRRYIESLKLWDASHADGVWLTKAEPSLRFEGEDLLLKEASPPRGRVMDVLTPISGRTLARIRHQLDIGASDEILSNLGVVSPSLGDVPTAARAFRQTIVELCDNIVEHAAGGKRFEGTGFAIIRPMPKGFPVIRLCVGDIGIGLKARMREMGEKVDTDSSAIHKALLVRWVDPVKEGLFDILCYIPRWQGRMIIRSGEASGEVYFPIKEVLPMPPPRDLLASVIRKRLTVRPTVAFSGVQVLVDLRLPKALDHAQWRQR